MVVVIYAVLDCGVHPVKTDVNLLVCRLHATLHLVNVTNVILINGECIVKMLVTHRVPGTVTEILDIALCVETDTGVKTVPANATTQNVNNALDQMEYVGAVNKDIGEILVSLHANLIDVFNVIK